MMIVHSHVLSRRPAFLPIPVPPGPASNASCPECPRLCGDRPTEHTGGGCRRGHCPSCEITNPNYSRHDAGHVPPAGNSGLLHPHSQSTATSERSKSSNMSCEHAARASITACGKRSMRQRGACSKRSMQQVLSAVAPLSVRNLESTVPSLATENLFRAGAPRPPKLNRIMLEPFRRSMGRNIQSHRRWHS